MGYQEIWQPYREEVEERFPLVMERLRLVSQEEWVLAISGMWPLFG